MFLLRKFYDTAEAGLSAGSDTAVATETKPEQPLSFAEAMAKGGTRTANDNPAEKPIVNKTENKEKPEPVEAKTEKVETTTTTSNEAEKAKPESLSPKEEVKEVTQPQKEAVTLTQPSWQEVLKSQQPDLVLKELGFDDKKVAFLKKELDPKMLNFLSIWENKGDVIGYLKELTTDYAKMTPEEVMRHQLREEYPKANQKAFEALYKKKIVEQYNLDSEDPDEAEEGKMLLEAEADKYRDKFTARQQEKLLPEPPKPKPPVVDSSAAERKQEFEAYMSTINKDPYAEKVFEKKSIQIGKGEDKFNYPIEPEAIKQVLFDTEKWTETQFDKSINADGSFKYSPKVQNQILTAAFAINPQKFLDDYAQHYLSLGGKKVIEPINNAKPADQQTVSNTVYAPTNLVEAMAKGGVKVHGGV